MANESRFSGEPETVWLTEGGKSDRHMRVLKPFWYRDWQGKQWDAPAGTIVDGATIPQALWTLVGSPYTGDYRRASIVHDVACVGATPQQRRAADKMFFQACRDGGCNVAQAMILYTGVRVGAWASTGAAPMWKAPFFKMENAPQDGPRLVKPSEEERMERDFSIIGEAVLRQGETDDVDELERRVDQAAVAVSGISKLSVL